VTSNPKSQRSITSTSNTYNSNEETGQCQKPSAHRNQH
jgi:hypothetical protein